MSPSFKPEYDITGLNQLHQSPCTWSRIAVIYEAITDAAYTRGDQNWMQLSRILMQDALTHFDYFPTHYCNADAPQQVRQTLEQIRVQHESRAYDLLLIIGGLEVEVDIGLVHQVLAPWIAQAHFPVYTALGPDDAETILGDTASKTFDSPESLLQWITESIHQKRLPIQQLISRIQSLSRFLLTENETASKIIVQTALAPELKRRLGSHRRAFQDTFELTKRIAKLLEHRVKREEGELNQIRMRIDNEVVRLATSPKLWKQKFIATMRKVQFSLLVTYLATMAFLMWWTSLGNTVFIGGCLLILLSGIYVAISNHLWDEQRAAPISLEPRLSNAEGDLTALWHGANEFTRRPTSQFSSEKFEPTKE